MKDRRGFFNLFLVLFFVFGALGVTPQPAAAVSSGLRISQVYGAGGNSGAVLNADYIEIFNAGDTALSLNGLSLQYASATGTGNFGATDTQLTELPNVLVQPGQYFLVQEAGGANGAALPTPDFTDPTPIGIAASAGKVALVNSITSLGCNGSSTPCDASQLALIIDLVGFGTANFYEGSAAAPAISITLADFRASGGCVDTDDNAADFTAEAPAPRNTASPTNLCAAPPAPALKINEFVFNHSGTDTNEFIEVFGTPDTDYSDHFILQLEGDTDKGLILSVDTVGVTDSLGFWWTGFVNSLYQNGSQTLLLVKNFTGAQGDDLDLGDDGTLDSEPWDMIVDSVAVSDGGATDIVYSPTVLIPGYDGNTFTVGGASRIPDGYDTDSPMDWVRNVYEIDGSYPDPGDAYNTPGASNTFEGCSGPYTPIYDIQGNGDSTPLDGLDVISEGIVVGDFQVEGSVANTKNGFYMQDPTGDGDPATSDGIFVFWSGSDLQMGDHVRVVGTATEYFDLTQIGSVDSVQVCDVGQPLPAPTALTLPLASDTALEAYEGMLVTFPQDLVISEYFEYDRYGSIVLTSQRQVNPTALVAPGPDAVTLADAYQLDRIILDDARSDQNPISLPHPNGVPFSLYNRFRGGDLVTNLTGIVDYSYSLYRIQAVQPADYTPVNLRTPEPDIIPGDIKVASLNVLNYFTTIDAGKNICGPAVIVDIIGKIGEDPGTAWGTDPVTTANDTLRRKETVCTGDVDWSDDFDPATEWDGLPENTFDGLGTHSTTCTVLDDLIISEYVEGSSNNKAIEIYNGTGADVDLNDYKVVLYTNGYIDPGNTLTWPEGTLLANGASYVIANSSAADAIKDVADIFSDVTYFNGDDVVALQKAGAGAVNCRGADSQEELDRQRAKILAALSAMDADVVGLIEIENDRPGLDPDYPVADLVNGLNDIFGAGTYDYIPTGYIGTDAIKVALIYKPATVTPIGDFAILDQSVDARFLDDFNRPALAQTFESNMVGEAVTVAVNHLKSKGSDCEDVGDPDEGLGAGNCNLTRLAAAQAEVDWLAGDPTGTGVDRSLIIGDLNSYDKEAPITAIKDGPDDAPGTGDDYFDLILDFLGEDAYSYVFDGQVGYLDYAMANANLLPFVTDVDVWHINADEPDLLDYDTTFKPYEQELIYYPDAYRASDHDPVLVTLTFNKQPMAVDDFYETDQDMTLLVDLVGEGVLANDSDANVNDVISLDVIVPPAHGTLTLNQDGTFEYIPDLRFFGEDHFEYLLVALAPDRAEFSDTAIVTITVHPKYQYYMPINFGW